MITVNELFSGIGTQSLAFKYLGIPHKVVGMAEIDKNAIKAYETLHGETRNYGDVSEVEKLDYADFWTYSFPCFTGDTLVLTTKGYIPIKDIEVGMEVITHKNRVRKVVNWWNQGEKEIYKVTASCIDEIKTTSNHKFWVRTRTKKWNNKLNKYTYIYSEPYWKECKDLTTKDYICLPINKESKEFIWNGRTRFCQDGRVRHVDDLKKLMNNKSFWWLMGVFTGDGWIRYDGGIIICCNKKTKEKEQIVTRLDECNFNYNIAEENSVYKIHIPKVELDAFCEQFGRGASNKRVPKEVMDLPTDLLKSYIQGYMSADGCITNGLYKATSVSRELLYGIGQCVIKCYSVPFRLYKINVPEKTEIEGRIVNQKTNYQLVFDLRGTPTKSHSEDGFRWFPIRKVEPTYQTELVYDIEVEEDHSFLAQGIAVHNCQDLSAGGKGAGLVKGTRSGLLWEVERLLEKSVENKEAPKYLLLENVPDLLTNSRHKMGLEKWLAKLVELGYYNYYGVINAADCGVPQNRERVFVISIRKDIDKEIYFFNINKQPTPAFDNFVEDEVKNYTGPLMVDSSISPYLVKTYERDIEEVSKADKYRTPIFTNDATVMREGVAHKSGFQDKRVGLLYSPTIRHQNNHTAIFYNNQIHKLTAKEAWLFMGIKEEDYQKVEDTGMGKTVIYGLAGNAIVVNVLMEIYKLLFIKGVDY